MADDHQFASRPDNKRKFDDQGAGLPSPGSVTPPTRRPTGFSAPTASAPPDSAVSPAAAAPAPPSYNNVPPPGDPIELAKQRAQQIAARLLIENDQKRPRVENGGAGDEAGDKGFGSAAADHSHRPLGQQSQFGMSAPTLFPPYSSQGTSKKIDIPNGRVGVIIGKGGETIKYLQLQSGAKIQVTRDMDADPNSQTRLVELMGSPDQISKAEQLINDVLAEAEAGGSVLAGARRFTDSQVGGEQFVMKVPNNKVGLVIGKGGETIKSMQARSGARIQIIPLHLPPGDTSMERTLQIDGTKEQIESAKQLVNEVISENRVRNPSMGGGYPQQGYHAPRPTSWGPPAPPPAQQPGYGYMQPGAYPGAPPQYNMSQPPYAGYPTPPVSAGYSGGWDQSSNPPSQQTTAGTGYDYYSQQQSQNQQPPAGGSAPTDNTGYGYGQPQPSSYNTPGSYGESTYSQPPAGQPHAYGQDGYSGGYPAAGPQPGYSHPPNAQAGYEQQQSYGSAPAYGAQDGSNTTYGAQGGSAQVPPGQVPQPAQPLAATQQGYPTQPPSSTPSYPSQGTQPGYGMPPTSQPGYGSQPPAQTGYGQAALTSPNYGQPPPGQKPPPQAVYGQAQQPPTSQAGYVQPAPVQTGYTHAQPPAAPSGYIQQDPTHHRGPPSSFGSAGPQPGYGQPSYGGTPPRGQPGYTQQQQPYSDSYGGGAYSQPLVYANDNAGGSIHGSYDAPPTAPAVPSGVTKASPQS